jgi:hypothetical protein
MDNEDFRENHPEVILSFRFKNDLFGARALPYLGATLAFRCSASGE